MEVVQTWSDLLWQAEVDLVALGARIAARLFQILDGVPFHPDFDLPGARDFLECQSHDAILNAARRRGDARNGWSRRNHAQGGGRRKGTIQPQELNRKQASGFQFRQVHSNALPAIAAGRADRGDGSE